MRRFSMLLCSTASGMAQSTGHCPTDPPFVMGSMLGLPIDFTGIVLYNMQFYRADVFSLTSSALKSCELFIPSA